MELVIAEKPSVARDLARVLGVRPSGRSHFEGKDQVITWCVGHLVELEEPSHYDPRWKAWRMDCLPMVPAQFALRPVATTRDQLDAVCGLLKDERFTQVVNACDAGREGELIFRYVYQLAGSRHPIKRLWVSSLTDEAIRKGFASLRSGEELEPLSDAARCRSEADWLVGLNATRAVTLRHRTGRDSPLYSIGRVQTPTLAILVERERAILAFKPQDYFLVKARFTTAQGMAFSAGFALGKSTRFATADLAHQVQARAERHKEISDPLGPRVEKISQTTAKEPPPMLFDLTSLQRTANRRFGLSAQATLDVAQSLYERSKVLTYPRTDSRHLSLDMKTELGRIMNGLAGLPVYSDFARHLLATQPNPGKRVFDDSKVSDHHAIIPTGKTADIAALNRDEARIFDLVVRRFLGAFYPDAEFAQTELIMKVGGEGADLVEGGDAGTLIDALPPLPDRFVAKGKVRLVAGWQDVAGFADEEAVKVPKKGRKKEEEDEDLEARLPSVIEGEGLSGAFSAQAKKTKPPTRHTEATLLSAMEHAGRLVEDEALAAAMRERGLGTPATRANIIETLLKRAFITRDGKALAPTPMGMGLIEALPISSLASPELTGAWEARLSRIARKEDTRAAFMADIVRYVQDTVSAIRSAAPMPAGPRQNSVPEVKSASRKKKSAVSGLPSEGLKDLTCPVCKQGTLITGKRGWGCARWREGCTFVYWFEENGKVRSEADLKRFITRA